MRDPKNPTPDTSFGLPQGLPESLTINVCFADYKLLRLFEVHLISSFYFPCLSRLSGSFVSCMSSAVSFQSLWIYGLLKVSNENSKFELLVICLLSSAFMDPLESPSQVESC